MHLGPSEIFHGESFDENKLWLKVIKYVYKKVQSRPLSGCYAI